VVIYDILRWAEALSSLTGYITYAGRPSLEVRREEITLCVIVTQVVGRCGRCLRSAEENPLLSNLPTCSCSSTGFEDDPAQQIPVPEA